MMWDLVTETSAVGLMGLLVSAGVVVMAVVYAIWPNEQRLALMRPLSLAAIFGGLSTLTLGVSTVLRGVAATGGETIPWRGLAAGLAEAIIGLFVAFGSLTIAWILVTFGLRRAERAAPGASS
jgi:membrane-associated PAP2 superfamily phosphatase